MADKEYLHEKLALLKLIWVQNGFNPGERDQVVACVRRPPTPKTEDEEELVRGAAVIPFRGTIVNWLSRIL